MTAHTKKTTKKVDTVMYLTCDGCGKKSDKDVMHTDLADISIVFGYGSKHDGFKYSGHICDDCAEKILQLFPNLQKKEYI